MCSPSRRPIIPFVFLPARMQLHKEEEKIGHSPTLNTVLMVERVLRGAGEVLPIAEIKRRLPKKVMHGTLLLILDYLQHSGKIIIGTKGILWIFTERQELDRLIKGGIEV